MLLLATSAWFNTTLSVNFNLALTTYSTLKGDSMADDKDPNLQTDSPLRESPAPQNWSVFVDPNKYQALGFLQMCIEKRFHMAVQERFKEVTGLGDTDYWIHTDAGGSPNMESAVHLVAPKYCYNEGARIMGWSAHGSKCGGFPGRSDEYILNALRETLSRNSRRYSDTWHLGFFAREGPSAGEIEILVIEPERDE
jgi:hypothetical protein